MTSPKLIRPSVVEYDSVGVAYFNPELPETRSRLRRLSDACGITSPEPNSSISFTGRMRYSDCVIDFGAVADCVGPGVKLTALAFDTDALTMRHPIYYGIVPVERYADGTHRCIIDYMTDVLKEEFRNAHNV